MRATPYVSGGILVLDEQGNQRSGIEVKHARHMADRMQCGVPYDLASPMYSLTRYAAALVMVALHMGLV